MYYTDPMGNQYDRGSKDYYEKERRTSTLNVVICVVFLLMLICVVIGMCILEQPQKEIITGIVCTVIFAVITGLIIRYHLKKFVLPKINDSEEDPAKESMYKRKDGEDMFDVLDRYRKKAFLNMILIMASLAVLIGAVLWLSPQTAVLGITIPRQVMAVFYVFIFFGIGAIADKATIKYKSSGDLKKELYVKGFDPDKVNLDFMRGSTHSLPGGFMVIGQDYYVVYNRDIVHVCPIRDVMDVSGVSNVEESKADNYSNNQWHVVHVHEKDQTYSISVSNKISIDTVLDEFRKKGIETSYKIMENDR